MSSPHDHPSDLPGAQQSGNHGANPDPSLGYSDSMRTATPGMDNFGPNTAGRGINGLAYSLGNRNDRDAAARNSYHEPYSDHPVPPPHQPGTVMSGSGYDNAYLRPMSAYQDHPSSLGDRSSDSLHSGSGLVGAGAASDAATPHLSRHSLGDPYVHYPSGLSSANDPQEAFIDPDNIVDDGDDGFLPEPQRRSLLSFHRSSGSHEASAASGAAAGAGVGAAAAAAGNMDGGSGQSYSPVAHGDGGEKGGASAAMLADSAAKKSRAWKIWLFAIIIVAIIAGAITGGILGSWKNDSPESSSSSGGGSSSSKPDPATLDNADEDLKVNGDLDLNSEEIKALMDNPNLHKVFYGMDYTPWGVQYPECLTWPPSQNNVTRDLAVISQLTDRIRLYGMDCNQTEMVLHAIDRLELKDMKLWLGVWIDVNNDTTTKRQMDTLEKVLDEMDDYSLIEGVAVGNEVLFAAAQSPQALQALVDHMDDVRDKLKKRGIDVPVATSDLGSNWTPELAKASDVVMANVHPLFGGVPVEQAASWTWTFFEEHDASLVKGTKKDAIISEIGWPTGGGNSCGQVECQSKKDGAVAGIDELNKFMEDWVCPARKNGTKYFW